MNSTSYAAPTIWLGDEVLKALSLCEYAVMAAEDIHCMFPERESFLASLRDGMAAPVGWEFLPQGLTRTALLGANSIYGEHFYQGISTKDGVIIGGSVKGISLGHTYGSEVEFIPTRSGFLRIYTPETAEWTEDRNEMCSLEELMFMQLVAAICRHAGRWDDSRMAPWGKEEEIFILTRNTIPKHPANHGGYGYYPNSGWEVTGIPKGNAGWKRVFIPFKPSVNPLQVELPELAIDATSLAD